ncbi:MAG: histidine kinase [Haloarculaceae archaeon]
MITDQPRIGITCAPGHEVFGPVADRLRARGYAVTFFDPEADLAPADLDDLALFVNKKIRWQTLDALAYAYRAGVPAWNGYLATAVFVNRLSQLQALAAVGFAVPDVTPTPPDGDYVAKGFFDLLGEPTLNGTGHLYQPLLDFDGVDHKYYAVDDGRTVHTVVTCTESKLLGERRFLGRGTVDPTVERRVRRLLRFADARALGVDVVEVDGTPHAVDVNPATSFRRTGLEDELADSIADAARW